MENSFFIFWWFSIAAIVLIALVAWIAVDYRMLRRTLADYEKRGITRGSRSTTGM
jgi:hypothetical protein